MRHKFICWLVALFISLPILATDTRFYYCEGDQAELTFFQIFETQENLLEIEYKGRNIKSDKAKVTQTETGQLDIKISLPEQVVISLQFDQPKHQPILSNSGVGDYQHKFTTIVSIEQGSFKAYKEIICEVYGLDNKFFDEIMPCFQ